MADLDAALVQQFLDISVAERKMVIQPDGVLDDGHGEAVAVRLGIGHGGSAYPSPIKVTQPFRDREGMVGFTPHRYLPSPSFRYSTPSCSSANCLLFR